MDKSKFGIGVFWMYFTSCVLIGLMVVVSSLIGWYPLGSVSLMGAILIAIYLKKEIDNYSPDNGDDGSL